jgi:serine-type D-Ala-D-Ala carboxypeptidase (penicillin-binding protein 5/6)
MSIINGRREYQKRQVASLTKIMTCWVVINICKDPAAEDVLVTDIASDIRGTCANLKVGDILTVDQLLYGLMLPSGNDAAFALAQHFGKKLYKQKYKKIKNEIKSFQFDYHPYYAKYFLKEMNDFA